MATWVLSPLALSELQDILEYIADDSVAAAEKAERDSSAAFDRLVATPNMGWQRTYLTGPGFRWWPVHSYLVVYQPETQPLRIVRVLHGARDLDRLFHTEH